MVKCHSNMLSSSGAAKYLDEGWVWSSLTSARILLTAGFLRFDIDVTFFDKRGGKSEGMSARSNTGDWFELLNARRESYGERVIMGLRRSAAAATITNFFIMSAVSQTAKNYRVLLKHVKALPSADNWKGRVVEQVVCTYFIVSHPSQQPFK